MRLCKMPQCYKPSVQAGRSSPVQRQRVILLFPPPLPLPYEWTLRTERWVLLERDAVVLLGWVLSPKLGL